MNVSRVLRAGSPLAVVLAVASVAGAGSTGFGATTVRIGPDGLEPASLRIPAYSVFTVWQNDDAVAHTVEFEHGRCTLHRACRRTGAV